MLNIDIDIDRSTVFPHCRVLLDINQIFISLFAKSTLFSIDGASICNYLMNVMDFVSIII